MQLFTSLLKFGFLFAGTLTFAIPALFFGMLPFGVGVGVAERFARAWARSMLWASGARLHVQGVENVDVSHPQVMLCNHQGMLDIPCVVLALPVPTRFVAKHTFAYVPFFGWYLRVMGYPFVDRSKRLHAVRSLDQAADKVRSGTHLTVFPEGTRSPNGQILPFKKGPFMLAMKAGVPIVPMAINGSFRVLPKGSIRVQAADITLRFGTPIPTQGLLEADRDDLMRRVRTAIIDMHFAIGGAGGDANDAIAAPGVEGIGRAATGGPPADPAPPASDRKSA